MNINDTFGRLTVVGVPFKKPGDRVYWVKVRCVCGTEKIIRKNTLTGGSARSCGCLRREHNRSKATFDGESKTRLGRIFQGMHRRCYKTTDKNYPWYGAKGVKICPEWHDFQTFKQWALSNGYADALTIDRLDSTKGYSPLNCRWATSRQNSLNKPNGILYTAFGEAKCLTEWCDDPRCPITRTTLKDRISFGVPIELAITAKLGRGHSYNELLAI